MKNALALFALLVVGVTGTFAARQLEIGEQEWNAAEAAAAHADWPEAIAHARIAAQSQVPGSPWPERARARLAAIGHEAESRGDDPTAMLAYGALRTAVLSVRWSSDSEQRWRTTAEDGLVRLASIHPDPPPLPAASIREALLQDSPPGLGALALLSLGALAVLVGVASFLFA